MKALGFILFVVIIYGCEPKNKSIENDDYLKISSWKGMDGNQKLSSVKYFKNEIFVKEINYTSNGWQVIDSTRYIYNGQQLVRKISYKVEYDKLVIDSIEVINTSKSQFVIEIYKNTGDVFLSYFGENGDLLRKSYVSKNLLSNSEFNDSSIYFVTSYKDYLGMWNTHTERRKWYPNLFIDSVFKKDVYKLYEKKYCDIFHDCEYKIAKTNYGDIIQKVTLPSDSAYPYYGVTTLPMFDSISVVFNEYRISKVFVHFIGGETYNEEFHYSPIGQLIRIESWHGDKKDNVFITSYKYESVSQVE